MVDLARAYNISIPSGATKKQILPSMVTAEQQGVFRSAPANPWYLEKAARNSDMPSRPLPPNPEYAETIEHAPTASVDPPRLTRTGRKESDYHRKQRLLKEKGVKAFGLSRDAMDEMAAEHGIV